MVTTKNEPVGWIPAPPCWSQARFSHSAQQNTVEEGNDGTLTARKTSKHQLNRVMKGDVIRDVTWDSCTLCYDARRRSHHLCRTLSKTPNPRLIVTKQRGKPEWGLLCRASGKFSCGESRSWKTKQDCDTLTDRRRPNPAECAVVLCVGSSCKRAYVAI